MLLQARPHMLNTRLSMAQHYFTGAQARTWHQDYGIFTGAEARTWHRNYCIREQSDVPPVAAQPTWGVNTCLQGVLLSRNSETDVIAVPQLREARLVEHEEPAAQGEEHGAPGRLYGRKGALIQGPYMVLLAHVY